jgi:hypothetical protein
METVKVEIVKVSQDFDGLSIEVKTKANANAHEIQKAVIALSYNKPTGYIAPRVGTLEHNILHANQKYDLTNIMVERMNNVQKVSHINLVEGVSYVWELSNSN